MGDVEARVRALTREVGSLREDLRRETKKRERAVAQAKEAAEARAAIEAKVQELGYANRKLAAELDAAHDAARTASERDRRAIRTLRDGLQAVEQEVAQRASIGQELSATVCQYLDGLRALLLDQPGVDVLGPSLAQQVTHGLAGAMHSMGQISSLLSGTHHHTQSTHGSGAPAAPPPSMPAIHKGANDIEKQQLQDEVQRLRSQLRALVDKAAGAAGAASIELQALLRDAQSEAVALRAEVTQLHTALQHAQQEGAHARGALEQLRGRVAQAEGSSSQADAALAQLSLSNTQLEEQVRHLQQQASGLQLSLEAAKHTNSSLQAQLEDRDRQVSDQAGRLSALQSRISAQQADMRAALDLASSSAQHIRAAALAPVPSTLPAAGSVLPGVGSALLGLRAPPPSYTSAPVAQDPLAYRAAAATEPGIRPAASNPYAVASAAAAHHLLRSQLPSPGGYGGRSSSADVWRVMQRPHSAGPYSEQAPTRPLGHGAGAGQALFQDLPAAGLGAAAGGGARNLRGSWSQWPTTTTVWGPVGSQGQPQGGRWGDEDVGRLHDQNKQTGIGGGGGGGGAGRAQAPGAGWGATTDAAAAATAAAISARLRAQQASAAAAAAGAQHAGSSPGRPGASYAMKGRPQRPAHSDSSYPTGSTSDVTSVTMSTTPQKAAAMATLGARVRAALGSSLTDDAASAPSRTTAPGRQGGGDLKRSTDLKGPQDVKGPHMDQLARDMRDIDRELEELEARLGVVGR